MDERQIDELKDSLLRLISITGLCSERDDMTYDAECSSTGQTREAYGPEKLVVVVGEASPHASHGHHDC